MDLKSQYNELPFSVQQKIGYGQVRRYVFFGTKNTALERILRSKLVGYQQALVIKQSRKLVEQYGCCNEKELLECSNLMAGVQRHTTVEDQLFFGKLKWQTPNLN